MKWFVAIETKTDKLKVIRKRDRIPGLYEPFSGREYETKDGAKQELTRLKQALHLYY